MINRIPAFAGNMNVLPVQPMFGAARATEPRLVTVNGNGVVERMPDTMHLGITLQETGAGRKTVTEALNTKSTQLVEALKALKLPETVRIKSWFNPVSPTYEWDGRKQKNNGYQGSFQVSVLEKGGSHDEFPEHAAKIKQVADDMEAPFSGPNYDVSNREEAELEALGKAVEDARKKAKKVADQMGFELDDKPASVGIGAPAQDVYQSRGGMRSMAMAESTGGGAQASAESFQIAPIAIGSEQVQVRFSIKA